MVVPVAIVLMVAGLQEPVMALRDVDSNASGIAPTQYGPSVVKVGTILSVTVTSMLAIVAHWPAVGVKV